jgi:hypothetical protein
MKTKDRAWKTAAEAGMSMKTNGILAESGNVAENKGRKWYVVGGRWGPPPPPGIASESVTTFIGVSRRSHALGFFTLP